MTTTISLRLLCAVLPRPHRRRPSRVCRPCSFSGVCAGGTRRVSRATGQPFVVSRHNLLLLHLHSPHLCLTPRVLWAATPHRAPLHSLARHPAVAQSLLCR